MSLTLNPLNAPWRTTSPSHPHILTPNLSTVIYLAFVTSWSCIFLMYGTYTSHQWYHRLWKVQNNGMEEPPHTNSLWPLITLTPFSIPLIPTPLMTTSYSLPSFSLGLKTYSALVNSAGPTRLPYTIIARWLCDTLSKGSTTISAFPYLLTRAMPSLRVTT